MKKECEILKVSEDRRLSPLYHMIVGGGIAEPMQVKDELFPATIMELLG